MCQPWGLNKHVYTHSALSKTLLDEEGRVTETTGHQQGLLSHKRGAQGPDGTQWQL